MEPVASSGKGSDESLRIAIMAFVAVTALVILCLVSLCVCTVLVERPARPKYDTPPRFGIPPTPTVQHDVDVEEYAVYTTALPFTNLPIPNCFTHLHVI